MKFKDLFKSEKDYKELVEVLGEGLTEFENSFDKMKLNIVSYDRFKEVNDEKKEMESTVSDLNAKLEKITKESLTAEVFEQKKNEIINEYQSKLNESEAKYLNARKQFTVKDALAEAGAKSEYIKLLLKEFDFDKITEKDGIIEGVNEQMKDIQKNYSDLFTSKGVSNESPSEIKTQDGIHKSTPDNVNPMAKAMGINL